MCGYARFLDGLFAGALTLAARCRSSTGDLTIHRYDGDLFTTPTPDPIPADLARHGIAEYVEVFVATGLARAWSARAGPVTSSAAPPRTCSWPTGTAVTCSTTASAATARFWSGGPGSDPAQSSGRRICCAVTV